MDQANLWTRRSNTHKDKLPSVPTRDLDSKDGGKLDSPRFSAKSSHSKTNPFNTASPSSVKSPGAGASAFGLGTGAFASFGQANKTPKTPGTGAGFDFAAREKENKEKKEEEAVKPQADSPSTFKSELPQHDLKNTWNLYYRPPSTGRDKDYEKSIIKVASFGSAEAFWSIYGHLNRPSLLPTVSDYHIFKDGIRPAWEDDANKKGGKWMIRLKKGVADRYWEDLLLAIVGDQFMEASDEVCGAVLSVRSGEDVLSVWTKIDGGRNIKIRETIKRLLSFPPDTNIVWRSHDESIEQRKAVDELRQQKTTAPVGVTRRTSGLYSEEAKGKSSS